MQKRATFRQYNRNALVFHRTDRNNRHKVKYFGICGDCLSDRFATEYIGFIDYQQHRQLIFFATFQKPHLNIADLRIGLYHQNRRVNPKNRIPYRANHPTSKPCFRVMHSGRIQENILRIALCQYPGNSGTGCLRLFGNDR